MGYSARYHVASLAAVFLALGVGILIGTGLNSVVSDATKNLESSLRDDLHSAQGRADDLQRQLSRERAFGQDAYPGLAGGTLKGDRIAVIAFNDFANDVKSGLNEVTGSDSVTGARVQEFGVVSEPPDVKGLASVLRDSHVGGKAVRHLAAGDALTLVARQAGRALVRGGPLFQRVQGTLFNLVNGTPHRIDAVVVTRSPKTGLDPAQDEATNRLESGLLDGLRSSGVPVVGVETSTASPSSMSLFQGSGIATVDNVDQESGQVSLAYALAGVMGNFGMKSTADRLMPKLVHPRAVRPARGAGGSR
jgi:hypothetical protein